jgi:hypothetical protein
LNFSSLVGHLDKLRDASLIQRRTLTEGLLSQTHDQDLPWISTILAGTTHTEHGPPIPRDVVEKALSSASGCSIAQVRAELRQTGTLPRVAEVLLSRSSQIGLSTRHLEVGEVLSELAAMSAPGLSRGTTLIRLTKLLVLSEPHDAMLVLEILLQESRAYVSRSVLNDVLAARLGVGCDSLSELVKKAGWRAATSAMIDGAT